MGWGVAHVYKMPASQPSHTPKHRGEAWGRKPGRGRDRVGAMYVLLVCVHPPPLLLRFSFSSAHFFFLPLQCLYRTSMEMGSKAYLPVFASACSQWSSFFVDRDREEDPNCEHGVQLHHVAIPCGVLESSLSSEVCSLVSARRICAS